MPKRRATAESDDESRELDASPTNKRARTVDESEDDDYDNSRQKARVKKGKSKSHANGEEQAEGTQKDEIDSEAFESKYGQTVSDQLEAKRKKAGYGGVAEFGIIESIEMHQFMCHKSLSFTFGPNINFIIGHNGSGKSAVLSAITVALGGKTNSTGRGSGLKAFIREGQQVAEVTISLKNQGDEAFKPQEYGKSIFITRRFTQQGSSTWKIKSKDGRVISNKKEELAAICDHMNIQVDNPLNVLTQDSARQFLSTSTPGSKYDFFLRGTQLSQLSDEYEMCQESITSTIKVLDNKRSALPDLEATFKEATLRFEEASKAREQKRRVDDLKRELAWSHVHAKEREMSEKADAVAKQAHRVPKVQQEIAKAQTALDTATADVVHWEQEVAALGTHDDLNQRHQQSRQKVADQRRELTDCKGDGRNITDNVKGLNNQIQALEAEIQNERNRLAADTQAKREEYQAKLKQAQDAFTAEEERHKALAQEIRVLEEESQQQGAEGEAKEKEFNTLRERHQYCQGMIQQLNNLNSNRYAAYGNGIANVLRNIARTKWKGPPPLGPLGEYIKVRESAKWAHLLRGQLSRLLTAFAVTNADDQRKLRAILNEMRNPQTTIIIFEPELFDYSHGEPASDLPTVLRALEFSDEHVKRIFINQRQIERMFLGVDRSDGEDILKRANSGHAWTADGFDIRRFPDGGGSTNPITLRTNDASSLLLTDKPEDEKGRYQAELDQLETQFQPMNAELERLRQMFSRKKNEIKQKKEELNRVNRRMHAAKSRVRAVEEEGQEEVPVDLHALEESKKDNEDERASFMSQYEDILKRQRDIEEELNHRLEIEKQLREELEMFKGKRDELTSKAAEAVEKKVKADHQKRYWEDKLNGEQAALDRENEILERLQTEFEQWTTDATTYCERVETNRSAAQIQKQIDSVVAALKKKEQEQGYSVEEAAIEVNKAKVKLDSAKSDLKSMTNLNKLLRKSVADRMKRWQDFRLHIALRTKMIFTYNLSQRGFHGTIKFDHTTSTLSLYVQTEDQANNKARDKEIQALSGGEKSFSTICLLLSLWESIGCPLRCLDEFDVFMDAVNRRISMKMMIDTANQSDKKQYVLITPQDMNNINIGPTVRVHRMTDPERGQGVLAMAS